MSSPFIPPPAGTPIAPNTSARYYTRQQIFSRVPITGSNFTSGKNCSFVVEATGGRFLVPQDSRIVAKLKIKANGGTKLPKSVCFACDPVSNMFSAAMLSVNGTTVTSTASNVADISRLQLRTEHTKAGADGPGSAGLLSFNQTMTPEEVTSNVLDNAAGGSHTTVVDDATLGNTLTHINRGLFHKAADERSDKHELLLNNCSSEAKAADGDATQAIEISTPLGQIFPFCRQDSAFLPNVQARIDLTINSDYKTDMLFSEQLRGKTLHCARRPSTRSERPALSVQSRPAMRAAKSSVGGRSSRRGLRPWIAPVARITNVPDVEVEELYIDAMFAIPRAIVAPPKSI